MSFANFDLEAQKPPPPPPPSGENSELDHIINDILSQLQIFLGLVTHFDTSRKQLGTRRDSMDSRQQTDVLVKQLAAMETSIFKLLTLLDLTLAQGVKILNRQVVRKDRLLTEFNELHRQFNTGVRVYNEKKKSVAIPSSEPTESTPLVGLVTTSDNHQQVQEQINSTDLQYHVLLTEERNQAIDEVANGITEINTIFRDLGQLVRNQGDQLDSMENNVLQISDNTRMADQELVKANEYQKRKLKWSCILLVALLVIILIIVLAVVS